MFDVSFAEMALVIVVAILVIGPKELPVVVRKVTDWMHQLRGLYRQIQVQFADISGENEISKLREELQEQAKFIRDAEGNLYRTYDISDLMIERERAAKEAEASLPQTSAPNSSNV